MQAKITNWLLNGEVGLSSKAMACVFLGVDQPSGFGPKGYIYTPSDPTDFNRCLMLLELVPEAREMLPEVGKLNEEWGLLIARWDELESCFLEEVGLNWSKGDIAAKKTYALMKEICKREGV